MTNSFKTSFPLMLFAALVTAGLTQVLPAGVSQGWAQTPVSGEVKVINDEIMEVGGRPVRICGINSLEKGDGVDVLTEIVAGKAVECKLIGEGTPCDGRLPREFYGTFNAQCFADGDDIAVLLIAAGAAEEVPIYSGGAYSGN